MTTGKFLFYKHDPNPCPVNIFYEFRIAIWVRLFESPRPFIIVLILTLVYGRYTSTRRPIPTRIAIELSRGPFELEFLEQFCWSKYTLVLNRAVTLVSRTVLSIVKSSRYTIQFWVQFTFCRRRIYSAMFVIYYIQSYAACIKLHMMFVFISFCLI